MIQRELIHPSSIAVIGASNSIEKPGGKVLYNILEGGFEGPVYPVNPRDTLIQGLQAYTSVRDIPQTDLAILAIPAGQCTKTVKLLAERKGTKAFIILSAGFSEESREGAAIEEAIVRIVEEHDASLIGPNCIGMLTRDYKGLFTTPVPQPDPGGCDFISGSGATAVFIMENGLSKGLGFSEVFSVGNSAQTGAEDILAHLDETFDPQRSSRVKLLYLENIGNPGKLLFHARSLIAKGCRIAAVKAGTSIAGSRAASSHTGALAGSDAPVDALFRKAGIVRCYSREELTTVAGVLLSPPVPGRRFAVISHAGGPAVMLTDTLSHGGLEVPPLGGPAAEELKRFLFPGSSTANPIDFLATGTAEQLGMIIDFCETKFDNIDAMIVIFGSPGLSEVYDVYDVLHRKMESCRKPIFPVLPSILNVRREIDYFLKKGHIHFPEEVELGRALSRVYATPTSTEPPALLYPPAPTVTTDLTAPTMRVETVEAATPAEKGRTDTGSKFIDTSAIRQLIDKAANGYLPPPEASKLLQLAGISCAEEFFVDSIEEALKAAGEIGYPLVMKVVGPLHKSDIGGVAVDIRDEEDLRREYRRIMKIPAAQGILLQPMLSGLELFAGAKAEPGYGHLVLCGLGGIFVETLQDVNCGLTPLDTGEALGMVRSLRGYPLITGTRGKAGTREDIFADILVRISALVQAAPEIVEMDLNPLMGGKKSIVAVDIRIRIEKLARSG